MYAYCLGGSKRNKRTVMDRGGRTFFFCGLGGEGKHSHMDIRQQKRARGVNSTVGLVGDKDDLWLVEENIFCGYEREIGLLFFEDQCFVVVWCNSC